MLTFPKPSFNHNITVVQTCLVAVYQLLTLPFHFKNRKEASLQLFLNKILITFPVFHYKYPIHDHKNKLFEAIIGINKLFIII